MSDQRRASGGGKVTILSSGELAQTQTEVGTSAISGTSAGNARNARRKVGTTLERSFVDPGAGPSRQPQQFQQQQQQQQRPTLKAGKPVASAPTPMQQRPLTELEKAFFERTEQDQRWLLTFPLALKQLYFGFAESTNHEQTLTALINRFPELLAGNEQHPSAILVAIQRGNWTPAKHFVEACVKGERTSSARLLSQRCSGSDRRTFLIEAVLRVGQDQPCDSRSVAPAIEVILALIKACPQLLSAADSAGRNPFHYCAEQSKLHASLLLPLLTELRSLASASPDLARRFGSALDAADNAGRRPIDLLSSPSATSSSDESSAVHAALQKLMAELPVGADDAANEDEPMLDIAATPVLTGSAARDAICSALAQRRKAAEFVGLLVDRLTDPRIYLLTTVERPEQQALDWFGSTESAEVKQALTDVGLADFCDLVDRLL